MLRCGLCRCLRLLHLGLCRGRWCDRLLEHRHFGHLHLSRAVLADAYRHELRPAARVHAVHRHVAFAAHELWRFAKERFLSLRLVSLRRLLRQRGQLRAVLRGDYVFRLIALGVQRGLLGRWLAICRGVAIKRRRIGGKRLRVGGVLAARILVGGDAVWGVLTGGICFICMSAIRVLTVRILPGYVLSIRALTVRVLPGHVLGVRARTVGVPAGSVLGIRALTVRVPPG